MRLNGGIFRLLAVSLAAFTFLSTIVTPSYADPIDAAYVLNISSRQPTTFPQNAVARVVSLQLGLAMQRVMASGHTADESAAASLKKQIRNGLGCLLAAADDKVQAKIFGELLAVIVNTPARAKSVDVCLISPDQLSNKEKI